MPLFDETVAFTGLSKPSDMSGFILKPVLQYGGAYFSYNPRAKDASELTSPWSNSSTTLLDTRGPISHASGATTGGDNSSLPYDNPVFLAIPKAVYGHNPCCHDLGCMMGHRYSGEHRSQTGATADFEHSWTRGEAYHSQISPLQQKGQDKLQGLPLHPSEEQVKSTITESLSRGRPTRMGPNYSGYPCVSPLSMATSLSEQSRHLQPSPGGYAGFHPSHATYEHMTSELYQECSPMSKYGHPTKHSMFYYPQANAEVENRTHCGDVGGKQREDVPVAQKSPIANPRERYTFPQTLHGDIPLFLHSTETQPNHTFLQGFGYPCYARPGFPSGPIRNVERHHLPPGLLSHRISVSPSDQCLSPSASLQKSTTNRHFTPLDTSHSFLRLDPISPTQHVGQSGLPSCIQISRLYPSITHRLDPQIDQPVLKPSGLTKDRLLDQSSNVCQFTCPKHPKDHQVSPGTLLSQSPKRGTDCLHSTLTNGPDFGTVIATTKKHNGLAYNSAVSFLKGGMKRPFPSLLKIKEEPLDLCEVDLSRKRRKLEMEGVLKRNQESPEMPVIDNVFSLAPDLRYLKTPGVLLPELQHQRSMLMLLTEHCKVQPTTLLKEIKPDPAEQPIYVCPQRPEAQLIEPGKIKVENINQSDPRDSSENCPSHTACSTIPDQIKLQPEDESLSDTKSTLVIQICKPEKLECKPSSPEADDPSYPPKSPSSQSVRNDRTPEDQVVNTEPKPASPLKPPEAELDVKTSPPESLVCSTYNTHPADMEVCRPPAPQEAPLQIQEGSSPRKQKPQSVRKHFLELHRTLCKQVSKCVSNTSEQQLRTWRSQLELVEPSSTKVQKVSCLLGIKARHKWLNKEISSALQEVLDRFREYIVHKRCPFPHVMRTGAVFLPMLVIKEILFPLVPGNFIDQVLQEHKVELRPTTLSEEKILIQVHKPCTSRLRRLMSLKHLPNVYTDVLNLLYYSNVCKHLESTSADVLKTTQE
ncbi:uncharacterized protein C15orf39 homolog [Syngnathoides biaculeatus]|uniref:uncharacterized protein C15orf39 homolog n=1 Tax=Syngnathoides biaculeatus TaxID=300417 RepID=UPI002ADDA50A|nr:uncharacterized protein C15orf39 homolog [Syngnathoides biaculeatus]XP_061678791.1 uncharacterized protein C15orf39 homolog [Syngnathoides biaculeatus]XP_061678792.1 uncharacterized protein C15orf39 homolog [Syngnathoides biaculeatus]